MEKNILLRLVFILIGVSSIVSNTKIDLAFLLDGWPIQDETTSVAWQSVKDLLRNIYGSFPLEDNLLHVAMLTSGVTAKIDFDFNAYNDLDSLDEAVDELSFPKYSSNIGKAMDLANYGLFRNSGRPDAVKILVVVAKNKSSDDVSPAARELRNSGVNILSVGIGQGFYRDDLNSIVSPPKQYNTFFTDFKAVEKLGPVLVKRIRTIAESGNTVATPLSVAESTKTVGTLPPTKQQENVHKDAKCSKTCEKQVEGGEKIPINCNNCKLAECCDMCCNNGDSRPVYSGPVEVVFLLDESGELQNWNNFEMMKSFMKNLTREFDVSNKKTRLGVIAFTNDNVQIYDLRSYHERPKIDSQIDKLNYDGSYSNSGPLNKGLDASQTNLFAEPRDLSVPRILLVFDSATVKDDQTAVKAFKLQASDVQIFCIGLGISYDKKECDKMVENPLEKHSLAAQVTQLSELQATIMLMIVNDIAEKYCPLCGQGTTDACRPCKASRHYIGKDYSVDDIKPNKVLNIVNTFDKVNNQNILLKSGPKLKKLKHKNDDEDEDDDEDDDDDDGLNQAKGSKHVGAIGTPSQDSTQLGTPLPNVDLVKDLLQTGTALDPDQNTETPLIANNQLGLLQKQPGISQQQLLQQQVLQQPLLQQQPLPSVLSSQFAGIQSGINQNPLLLPQNALPNANQLSSSQPDFLPSNNANFGGATGLPGSVQPVTVDTSLLKQAVLGTGQFQRDQKPEGIQRKHVKPDGPGPQPSEPASDSPPTQSPDAPSSNDVAFSNPGMTPSIPVPPVHLHQETDVEDSVPPEFQSLPPPPAVRLHGPSPLRVPKQDEKFPFEDEYKYDQFDKQGPFIMGCRDLSDDCASYATEGGCDDWAALSPIGQVKVMCKKSCGLCDMGMEKPRRKSQTKQRRKQLHWKPKKH